MECVRVREQDKATRAVKKRGQMLVVIMLMLTTVIIMFGMTVSIGHLVQSRINLQNAVDLAGMSAVSYEARNMNGLSIVNFRIRQVLRFFLLDSYATQGRFNKAFENEVGTGGSQPITDPRTSLAVCEQARNYQPVASIGESGRGVDQTTNVCWNLGGKAITPLIASPIIGIDPQYILINAQLAELVKEFKDSCNDWSNQNGVWTKWAINRAVNDTKEQLQQTNGVLTNFSLDMGFGTGAGGGGGIQGSKAGDAATLTFNANLIGSLQRTVLNWSVTDQERVLQATDLQISTKPIGLLYVEPIWTDGGGCSIVPNNGGAQATAQEMIQGFSKNPDKTVVMGLVASSYGTNILFWPQGIEPVMAAYTADKPFGSRIGPPQSYFQNEGSGGYGNMALFPGDNAIDLTTGGLGRRDMLLTAVGVMPNPGSGYPSYRPVDSMAGLAYAPTIFDSIYYSVFPPQSIWKPVINDTLPTLTINTSLTDRGGTLPDPKAWEDPSVALPNYYNAQAITSGWSPNYNGGDHRIGYQIKMISLQELCQNTTQSLLLDLCAEDGATL